MMGISASAWIICLVYLTSCWTGGLSVTRERRIYNPLNSFKDYVKDEMSDMKYDIGTLFGSVDNLTVAVNQVRCNVKDDGISNDNIGIGSGKFGNQDEWTNARNILKDPHKYDVLMKAFQAEKLENRIMKERLISIEESIADVYQECARNITVLSKEISNFRNAAELLPKEPLKLETISPALKHNNCKTVSEDGVHDIYVESTGATVSVYCDQTTDGGGWIVFMRRKDGSQNFHRSWSEYKNGFGEKNGEFWAGNEFLYHLTARTPMQLRIDMTDFDGNTKFAQYNLFQIGSEEDRYKLHVSDYSGNAGDSLIDVDAKKHVLHGMSFSTFDSDNDQSSGINCVAYYTGGWWFNSCFAANLNANYSKHKSIAKYHGIIWKSLTGWKESLQFVEMKVR